MAHTVGAEAADALLSATTAATALFGVAGTASIGFKPCGLLPCRNASATVIAGRDGDVDWGGTGQSAPVAFSDGGGGAASAVPASHGFSLPMLAVGLYSSSW